MGFRRYGDVARTRSGDSEYILNAVKTTVFGNVDVTWLSFKLSRKTAKKVKGNKLDDEDLAFGLVGDTPISAIRAIMKMVSDYLVTVEGDVIAVTPYRDGSDRRSKAYESAMGRLGWKKMKARNKDPECSWDHVTLFVKA